MPLPMFLLAPVTSATFPDSSFDTIASSSPVSRSVPGLLHGDDVLRVAVERRRLLGEDPYELAALHLEQRGARRRLLGRDVAGGEHPVGVEGVDTRGRL